MPLPTGYLAETLTKTSAPAAPFVRIGRRIRGNVPAGAIRAATRRAGSAAGSSSYNAFKAMGSGVLDDVSKLVTKHPIGGIAAALGGGYLLKDIFGD